jgi:hypothetical protein
MSPEEIKELNDGAAPHFARLKAKPDPASLPELGLDFYASVSGRAHRATSTMLH